MSALSERDYLADEICELFTKLTGDAYAEDMARARKLAEGGNPHDHWLHTTRLDYESRLFMYMAAAFAMRCMKAGIWCRSNAAKCLTLRRENAFSGRICAAGLTLA